MYKQILLIFFVSFIPVLASARVADRPDTIYYLIDNKTPVNDRLITIEKFEGAKRITFNCRCLTRNGSPTFEMLYEDKYSRLINKRTFDSLKFISTQDLISFVQANNSRTLSVDHKFYFVEEDSGQYIRSKAFFNYAEWTSTSDWIITGSPKNTYYLFEPDKVPKNDRLITVSDDGFVRRLVINCRCMPDKKSPELIFHSAHRQEITAKVFKTLRFIPLSQLVWTWEVPGIGDNGLFVVERKGNKYFMTRASFH